jgi:4-amino-4-deoxy-L-arabinose transferase-like glycosyltransferase
MYYKKFDNNYYSYLAAIIFVIINSVYLLNNQLPLYADEAQYWSWSQHLDFGYFSKPPMIAWQIFLSTSIFGNEEFGIRIGSSFFHAFSSIIIYHFTNKLTINKKTSILAQITYLTLPAVVISSSIASTDAPLIFFWMASLSILYLAVNSNKIIYFILFGIMFGFGMLTKFNMILILPCFGIYLLWSKKLSLKVILQTILSCIIAFLIYSPNLYWNFTHHFVSYKHTGDITHLDEKIFQPLNSLIFLASQALVFGPILFFYLLSIFTKKISFTDNKKYLLSFSLPFILLFVCLSAIGKANINWAAPAYGTLTIFIVSYALKDSRKDILKYSLILHLLAITIVYNFNYLSHMITNQTKINVPDPFIRMKGWPQVIDNVEIIAKENNINNILADERKVIALGLYYLRDSNVNLFKFNDSNIIHDHYDMSNNLANMKGKDFIFISRYYGHQEILQKYFSKVTKISSIEIDQNNTHKIIIHIYILKDFHGY